MKITGSMNYVKFDLENGYIIKAEGEMLVGRKFVVYTDTMKTWEPPHENEKLSKEQIEEIIREVQESMRNMFLQNICQKHNNRNSKLATTWYYWCSLTCKKYNRKISYRILKRKRKICEKIQKDISFHHLTI